ARYDFASDWAASLAAPAATGAFIMSNRPSRPGLGLLPSANRSVRYAKCKSPRGRRLRFEALEDRPGLATLLGEPSAPNGTTIFAKIGDAVTAAHSGDTVKVVAGSYLETVNVVKPLTLIGGQVRVPNGSSGSSVIQSSPAGIGFFLNANN